MQLNDRRLTVAVPDLPAVRSVAFYVYDDKATTRHLGHPSTNDTLRVEGIRTW